MYLSGLPTAVHSYILDESSVVEGTDGEFAVKEDKIVVNQPHLLPRFLGDDRLRLRRLNGSSLEEAKTVEDIILVICFVCHLLWIRFGKLIRRAVRVYDQIGVVGLLIELQHLDIQ